jgi:hypothetical protein
MDWMLYALPGVLLSPWVYHDAKSRGFTSGKAMGWALGVFIIWLVAFPLWLVSRPK